MESGASIPFKVKLRLTTVTTHPFVVIVSQKCAPLDDPDFLIVLENVLRLQLSTRKLLSSRD